MTLNAKTSGAIKIMIRLEDDQQKRKMDKLSALFMPWVELSSWSEVPIVISNAWAIVDNICRNQQRQGNTTFVEPKTLRVSAGIMVRDTIYQKPIIKGERTIRCPRPYSSKFNLGGIQNKLHNQLQKIAERHQITGWADTKLYPIPNPLTEITESLELHEQIVREIRNTGGEIFNLW